jgi:hypothetical protein
MKRYVPHIGIGLMLLCGAPSQGEIASNQSTPKDDSFWKPSVFSTLPGREAMRSYRTFRLDHPAEDWKAEVELNLGRNEDLRKWFFDYFANTPILYENTGERARVISDLSFVRAEWALRLFLQLAHDDRPSGSNLYSPEEVKDLIRANSEDPMTNRDLAQGRSNEVSYSGLPEASVLSKKGLSHSDWLSQPSQLKRLPEIVKATWGDQAVLNADIGLGPDNEPLAAGAKTTPSGPRPAKNWSAPGSPAEGEASPTASSPMRMWVAVASAVLLGLGAWVALRQRRASP